MPISTKWSKKKPPKGFEDVEPVLEALENELKDVTSNQSDPKIRKLEALWPVHQINWQKSRYIYDLYYMHHRISKPVYLYCINQKIVDAGLIAKWKKPGYERLCSTYVINPTNYKFGTTSICRVPWSSRSEDQKQAKDPTTGCMGCASGTKGGPRNIFGTKYGQNLAAVQLAREARMEAKQKQAAEAAAAAEAAEHNNNNDDDDETDDETDDEDDDFGPSPAAGIWAGSQRLEQEAEKLANPEEASSDDDREAERPVKKARNDE